MHTTGPIHRWYCTQLVPYTTGVDHYHFYTQLVHALHQLVLHTGGHSHNRFYLQLAPHVVADSCSTTVYYVILSPSLEPRPAHRLTSTLITFIRPATGGLRKLRRLHPY